MHDLTRGLELAAPVPLHRSPEPAAFDVDLEQLEGGDALDGAWFQADDTAVEVTDDAYQLERSAPMPSIILVASMLVALVLGALVV